MAQVFKPVGASDDKKFIAIVNHFKSKGSAATPEDTDKGQGASNVARTAQAKALLAFADELQKSKGTDKVFLIGDFNSYTKEDPIQVLYGAGYVNQDEKAKNADGSARLLPFGGLVGLAGPRPRLPGGQRRGHRRRHLEHQLGGVRRARVQPLQLQRAPTSTLPDQFRASDHDPVVVGPRRRPPRRPASSSTSWASTTSTAASTPTP